MLWGFKEASPLREGLRARIAIQVHANPRTGCGGKTKMSDGMRMFRILLAPGTRSLPKFRAHVRVLVLVLEYSRARARARVLVSARVLECSSLECSCSSTRCARLLVLDCSTARVLECSYSNAGKKQETHTYLFYHVFLTSDNPGMLSGGPPLIPGIVRSNPLHTV